MKEQTTMGSGASLESTARLRSETGKVQQNGKGETTDKWEPPTLIGLGSLEKCVMLGFTTTFLTDVLVRYKMLVLGEKEDGSVYLKPSPGFQEAGLCYCVYTLDESGNSSNPEAYWTPEGVRFLSEFFFRLLLKASGDVPNVSSLLGDMLAERATAGKTPQEQSEMARFSHWLDALLASQ